jgi:mRNA-degrading endonuclease RelE of RelBE toxin-antitoxin system
MARYRVIWRKRPRRELAAIWIIAPDKNSVTQAQATADRLLSTDPYRYGSPVSEGLWAITVAPLRISFEIDDARSRVVVTGVNRLA